MVIKLKSDDEPEVDTINKHLDYIQWYKSDGTPTSGKLPQDDYHKAKYFARGWTMKPRRGPENFLTQEEDEE